jgi:hypothetical protein
MAMMEALERKIDWEDIVNFVLGVVLVVSPGFFSYADQVAPTFNAWYSGFAIMALAVAAMFEFARWEEYLNIAVGLWLVASPFLLGYAAMDAITTTHLTVGVIVTALAGYEVYSRLRETTGTRKTA